MRCSLVPTELLAPPLFQNSLRDFVYAENVLWVLVLSLAVFLSVAPPANASTSSTSTSIENSSPWTSKVGLRPQALEALSVLEEAPEHGMPADRYALPRLTALASQLAHRDTISNEPTNPNPLFDELLTAALETYAIDLLQGLQPSAFKNKRDPWHSTRAKHTVSTQLQAAVVKGLHRAITTNRIKQFFDSIEPVHSDYKALQAALSDYRLAAQRDDWPEVPRSKSGELLEPGDLAARVEDLRKRLAVTDSFVATTVENPRLYDKNLADAVIRFQKKHGLKPDGRVGKNTRAALNVSADERVAQIELNLDRWRLMPKRMPANHIWVNVPQFEMNLQLEQKTVLDMPVVVGAISSPTPMMHDRLEHVVFSPYWHLPRGIAVREILPQVKADPGYLQKQNYEVLEKDTLVDPAEIDWQTITAKNFSYRFRQRPGSWNSLGQVKFIFPNNYAVYLHDTNKKNLFDKSMRALSHGCIRLEDPEALAAALLDWDRGWKRENVSRAMASGRQKYVKLGQTVPVYLVYFTATVKDGAVRFHNDIYGHDKRHLAQRSMAQRTMAQRRMAQENSSSTKVAKVIARYENSIAAASHAPVGSQLGAQIEAQIGAASPTVATAGNAQL